MKQRSIPLAGVIGAPIAHSRSPALHGHWLKTLGIKGYYVPLHIEADDLRPALSAMPAMGFVGANVTIPHKEAALKIADGVTARAATIGAANTLIFREDRTILADNTDGVGFIENLRENAPGWQADDGPVTVIGAGGAARAVLAVLLENGATEIRLLNRTRARAEHLAADLSDRIRVVDWDRPAAALDGAATLVNASALGMTGQPPLDLALEGLRPDAVVTDLVYTPLETAFLATARAGGHRVVDGLGMLIHQAIPGFEAWFGQRPRADAAARDAVLGS